MRLKSCASGVSAALCLVLCAAMTSGCLLPAHHASPDDVRGVAFLFAQGDRDMELRRYDAAASAFREAAGRAWRASGANDEHRDEWMQVRYDAHYRAALALAASGNFSLAAGILSRAASGADHPLKALAQWKRGGYLVKLGRIEEAKDEFRRVILDGKSPKYRDKIPEWLRDAAQEDFDRLK